MSFNTTLCFLTSSLIFGLLLHFAFRSVFAGLCLRRSPNCRSFRDSGSGGEIKYEWRMGSAARALQSGLSSVAETIYRSLLEKVIIYLQVNWPRLN